MGVVMGLAVLLLVSPLRQGPVGMVMGLVLAMVILPLMRMVVVGLTLTMVGALR